MNNLAHAVSIVEFWEKIGGFRVLPLINVHWWHDMAKKKKQLRDLALADLARLIVKYRGSRKLKAVKRAKGRAGVATC